MLPEVYCAPCLYYFALSSSQLVYTIFHLLFQDQQDADIHLPKLRANVYLVPYTTEIDYKSPFRDEALELCRTYQAKINQITGQGFSKRIEITPQIQI